LNLIIALLSLKYFKSHPPENKQMKKGWRHSDFNNDNNISII